MTNLKNIVNKHDLSKEPLSHVDETILAGFYTSVEHRNETLNNAVKDSEEAIKELMEANIIAWAK